MVDLFGRLSKKKSCTVCNSTSGQLHSYDGQTYCSTHLNERLAQEDGMGHEIQEGIDHSTVENSIGLDT